MYDIACTALLAELRCSQDRKGYQLSLLTGSCISLLYHCCVLPLLFAKQFAGACLKVTILAPSLHLHS